MRPRAFIAVLVITGSPTVAMANGAGSLSDSLWVGASGLQSRLTEHANRLELRAHHGWPFGDQFSGIARGTLLLRAHRSGDGFAGTAFVFGRSGCVLPYAVTGSITPTRMVWQGEEPKDATPGCRVTRTALATTTVRLKWAPPPVAAPAAPIAVLPVTPVVPPTSSPRPAPPASSPGLLGVEMLLVAGVALVLVTILGAFGARWAYLSLATILTEARIALAEKRSQLAAVPAAPARNASTLSAAEIENILAGGFPEIEPELRAALARVLAAASADKAGG